MELKNDLAITGMLHSVDQVRWGLHPSLGKPASTVAQRSCVARIAVVLTPGGGGGAWPQYLNIKLENTRVVDEARYPHMVRVVSAPS